MCMKMSREVIFLEIDITFDFRTDSKGKDPDNWSPPLKAYQRVLYSKPLPNGEVMDVEQLLKESLKHML